MLLPKSSEDLGTPITQTCNVIDVGELSLYDTVSHSGVLSALRRVAAIDQDYYPENLGVTLVCNAPWSFRAAWAVVRHFLDAKTQAKFVVVPAGEEGVKTLEKTLGVGRVPKFLGGDCCCPGGCVSGDPTIAETKEVLTTEQMTYAKFCMARRGGNGGNGGNGE